MNTVLWFTGLSGSGKTTIARQAKEQLEQQGLSVRIIDGDDVRAVLHRQLGFSREDVRLNNETIADMALAAQEDIVLVPVIAPYRETRIAIHEKIGDRFREIFVDAPLATCQERDTKGLYQKAQQGEISDMIGVSPDHPYERPAKPDLLLDTAALTIEESVSKLVAFINGKS